MCIIIHRPPGVVIPKDRLERLMRLNRDGWGVMWAEDGRVVSRKGIKMDEFWSHYEKLPGVELGVHFRIKTHGLIDDTNAHPYDVLSHETHGRDIKLMHNGVLNVDTRADAKKSDTWHYVEGLLRPVLEHFGDEFYQSEEFWGFLKEDVGHNRLLLLDAFTGFRRVGSGWVEREGVQFSNSISLDGPVYTAGSSTYYGRDHWQNHNRWAGDNTKPAGTKATTMPGVTAATTGTVVRYPSWMPKMWRRKNPELARMIALMIENKKDAIPLFSAPKGEVCRTPEDDQFLLYGAFTINEIRTMSDQDLAALMADKPEQMVHFIRELFADHFPEETKTTGAGNTGATTPISDEDILAWEA